MTVKKVIKFWQREAAVSGLCSLPSIENLPQFAQAHSAKYRLFIFQNHCSLETFSSLHMLQLLQSRCWLFLV